MTSITNEPRLLIVGASSGIGRSLAEHALQRGAHVCVSARSADALEEICAQGDGRGHAIVADLARPDDCRRMVDVAAGAMGGLDAVVIAAGWGTLSMMTDADPDMWRQAFEVNVIGPTLVCGAATEHLAPTGIVSFISSESASEVRWGLGFYAASKAALDVSIEAWRLEKPTLRFQRVVMGATSPTGFCAGFDSALFDAALEAWLSQGIRGDLMSTDDVGRQMADLIWSALANPGLVVSDVRLAPVASGVPSPT
ncbi:MAG: SDR family oxidoreductase [Mycobacterium sp.]